jgi:hypothetical protein
MGLTPYELMLLQLMATSATTRLAAVSIIAIRRCAGWFSPLLLTKARPPVCKPFGHGMAHGIKYLSFHQQPGEQ